MIHVRYYVEWVAGDNWHDAPTRYTTEISYLNKHEAVKCAELLKKDGFRNVRLVEFMQDLPRPVEYMWNSRHLTKQIDQWNWEVIR